MVNRGEWEEEEAKKENFERIEKEKRREEADLRYSTKIVFQTRHV